MYNISIFNWEYFGLIPNPIRSGAWATTGKISQP